MLSAGSSPLEACSSSSTRPDARSPLEWVRSSASARYDRVTARFHSSLARHPPAIQEASMTHSADAGGRPLLPAGGVSGLVRPDHQRARRHRSGARRDCSTASWWPCWSIPRRRRFSPVDERVSILRDVPGSPAVEVDTFDGLLVDYVERRRPTSSCAGCARSPTSTTSSRWRR